MQDGRNLALGMQVLTTHTLNPATLEARDLHCCFLLDILQVK